jgi:hypothetical protein
VEGPSMRPILCAFVLAVTCMAGAAAPAQAEGRHCVSPGEYRQVHRGMTKRHVHRVFDTRGRRVAFSRDGRFTSEIRRYRGCPRDSVVSVAYGNRRVTSKSAVWGS